MTDPSLPPIVEQPLESQATPSFQRDVPSTVQGSASDNALAVASASESSGGISSSRPLILGMLFGVTGALGLPLLWFSPVFNRKEKWLWSIINSLYTLGLIAIAIAALQVIFDAFEQLR